jgi:hypothetical protein
VEEFQDAEVPPNCTVPKLEKLVALKVSAVELQLLIVSTAPLATLREAKFSVTEENAPKSKTVYPVTLTAPKSNTFPEAIERFALVSADDPPARVRAGEIAEVKPLFETARVAPEFTVNPPDVGTVPLKFNVPAETVVPPV